MTPPHLLPFLSPLCAAWRACMTRCPTQTSPRCARFRHRAAPACPRLCGIPRSECKRLAQHPRSSAPPPLCVQAAQLTPPRPHQHGARVRTGGTASCCRAAHTPECWPRACAHCPRRSGAPLSVSWAAAWGTTSLQWTPSHSPAPPLRRYEERRAGCVPGYVHACGGGGGGGTCADMCRRSTSSPQAGTPPHFLLLSRLPLQTQVPCPAHAESTQSPTSTRPHSSLLQVHQTHPGLPLAH